MKWIYLPQQTWERRNGNHWRTNDIPILNNVLRIGRPYRVNFATFVPRVPVVTSKKYGHVFFHLSFQFVPTKIIWTSQLYRDLVTEWISYVPMTLEEVRWTCKIAKQTRTRHWIEHLYMCSKLTSSSRNSFRNNEMGFVLDLAPLPSPVSTIFGQAPREWHDLWERPLMRKFLLIVENRAAHHVGWRLTVSQYLDALLTTGSSSKWQATKTSNGSLTERCSSKKILVPWTITQI